MLGVGGRGDTLAGSPKTQLSEICSAVRAALIGKHSRGFNGCSSAVPRRELLLPSAACRYLKPVEPPGVEQAEVIEMQRQQGIEVFIDHTLLISRQRQDYLRVNKMRRRAGTELPAGR